MVKLASNYQRNTQACHTVSPLLRFRTCAGIASDILENHGGRWPPICQPPEGSCQSHGCSARFRECGRYPICHTEDQGQLNCCACFEVLTRWTHGVHRHPKTASERVNCSMCYCQKSQQPGCSKNNNNNNNNNSLKPNSNSHSHSKDKKQASSNPHRLHALLNLAHHQQHRVPPQQTGQSRHTGSRVDPPLHTLLHYSAAWGQQPARDQSFLSVSSNHSTVWRLLCWGWVGLGGVVWCGVCVCVSECMHACACVRVFSTL